MYIPVLGRHWLQTSKLRSNFGRLEDNDRSSSSRDSKGRRLTALSGDEAEQIDPLIIGIGRTSEGEVEQDPRKLSKENCNKCSVANVHQTGMLSAGFGRATPTPCKIAK